MANHSKDDGLALLQRNPSRELLLEKMRTKLASTPSPTVGIQLRKHEARRKNAWSWFIRGGIVLSLIGANYMFIRNKDVIVAKLGFEGVPSLPKPDRQLSSDEQALYWTYAMYDIVKFRRQFGVEGFYAIDQNKARRSLEALLPEVSPQTLGEISGYFPIAYKQVKGEAP
jgi:hypothetical protein